MTDDYLKEKERIYDIILEENIVLNKFLYDIFNYAERDIRERHGDEEYIAKDLKNMFFKVQREVRKIRNQNEAGTEKYANRDCNK